MPTAALLAVTPPPSKEEKRRKREASKEKRRKRQATKLGPWRSGSGRYLPGDIPRDILELGDIVNQDRAVPMGGYLDHRIVARIRKNLRAINALGNRPADD